MSLNYFKVEKGLKITEAGSDTGVLLLIGAGAPSMDAPVGSLYSDETAGGHYQKVAAGAGAGNWKELATKDDVAASIGTWRPERVVAVTSEDVGAGVRDIGLNPFTDDDGSPLNPAYFEVGKYVITDSQANTEVKLLKIESVSGTELTLVAAANPLVKDDTFVCEYYLPDSEGQESQAIVNFNGDVIVKIADANWGRADAIALAPSYAAVNGSITSADSVQSALEKLDGNQQDLISLSGVAQGETTFPAMTPGLDTLLVGDNILSAPSTANAAFSSLNFAVAGSSELTNELFACDDVFNDLIQIRRGEGGMAAKLVLCITPGNPTHAIVTLEVLACGISENSSFDSDVTVYAKLSPATRGGSAATIWAPEFQIVETANGMKVQMKCPSALGAAQVRVRAQLLSGYYYFE